jgi:hypothetical protein
MITKNINILNTSFNIKYGVKGITSYMDGIPNGFVDPVSCNKDI